MILCAAALAVLLVTSGVEAESIAQVLYTGCDRNLKSGTQCDTCEHWFHNSCGNAKAQMDDSVKLCCHRCRWDRLRQLEEKLENDLQQVEDLNGKTRDWKSSYEGQ
jgi:hypothetical protein